MDHREGLRFQSPDLEEPVLDVRGVVAHGGVEAWHHLYLLRQWEPVASLPRTARLALRICVGATIYTLAILIFHSERVRRFKSMMNELKGKGDSPSPDNELPPADRPRLVS